MKKYKQHIKTTYIICFLFVALAPSLQATQFTVKAPTANDSGYKAVCKISGIGLEIVKYIDGKDKNHKIAFHWSAGLGYLDCLPFLQQQGADIHDKHRWGDTTLIFSAQKGHLDIVKYLVQQGVDIHTQNGDTSLLHSTYNEHMDYLKLLLRQPAETCLTL